MSKLKIIAVLLLLANLGCASERLYVNVVDDNGFPASNATVNVGFSSGHVVFGKGRSCDYKEKTGQDGDAVVRFNGSSSDVYWSAQAEGYYPSDTRHETFNVEVVQIPPIFYKVNMLEHEKHGKITLYPKKNPQPMYAYTREMDDEEIAVKELEGDGSFDSPECLRLLDEADIVVTNPPFSRFLDFLPLLINRERKFLILGNNFHAKAKEIFPYFMSDQLWLGYNYGNMKFHDAQPLQT